MKAIDWQGNEIKAGDTIVVYRIEEEPPNSYRFVIFDFAEGKEIYSSTPKEEPPPKKYTWELIKEIGPLFESEVGISFQTESDGMKMIVDIRVELFFYTEKEIICIKGKSDSEVDFYKNYFK